MTAVARSALALEHAASDRETIMAAVARSGRALNYAAEELRSDREIVMIALAQNGFALKYVPEKLRSERGIVMAAIAQNGFALQYAAEKLRSDREIVMAAVARSGFALEHAAEKLRSDKEIVMAAVERNGRALKHADKELQCDREIVMAAVAEDGHALQDAAEELRSDREIVMAAVAQDGYHVLSFAAEGLRSDPEIVGVAAAQGSCRDHVRTRGAHQCSAQQQLIGAGHISQRAPQLPDQEPRDMNISNISLKGGLEEARSRVQRLEAGMRERIAGEADASIMMTAMFPSAPSSIGGISCTTELLSTDSIRESRHWRLGETGQRLGTGGFATVELGSMFGRNRHLETSVAIKKSKEEVEEMSTEQIQENACNEVRIMRALQLLGGVAHPNIVHMYGYTSRKTTLAMELCDGSLEDLLRQDGGLSAAARCDLMHQLSIACWWVVHNGIVHRDIKPANVLLKRKSAANPGFSEWVVKLADFGLAKFSAELADNEVHVGTECYWAPESILGTYSEKSDVFSFGISALETFLVNPRDLIRVFSTVRARLPDLDAKKGALQRELLVRLASTFGLAEEGRRKVEALLARVAVRLTHAVHQDPNDRPDFKELCISWHALA